MQVSGVGASLHASATTRLADRDSMWQAGLRDDAHGCEPRLTTSVLSAIPGGDAKVSFGGRPVATPCRQLCIAGDTSGVPPSLGFDGAPADLPTTDSAVSTGPLLTLLEQSRSLTNDYPLMLAATLLETLFEHFHDGAVALPAVPESMDGKAHTLGICLSEALPQVIQHDLTLAAMPMPFEISELAAVFSRAWILPGVLPGCLRLHPSTSAAFQKHVPLERGLASGLTKVDLYTDGSFDGSVSSWAFAAIGRSGTGAFLLAWARGRVSQPGEDFHIGATEHSAVNGERTAVFWAICWLLFIDGSVAREVHSDCLVAARQADGSHGATSQVVIASACRAIAHAHDAVRTPSLLAVSHVKGHSGDPYNELADVLAGAVALGDSPLPDHCLPLCRWAQDRSLEWLWLTLAASQEQTEYPLPVGNSLRDEVGHRDQHHFSLSPSDVFGADFSRQPEDPPATVPFRFFARFLTVNVQTLGEESATVPNRVPFVREQLTQAGCTFAGLQETRAKVTSTVTSHSHYRFLSACDAQGNHGVELWVSRLIPVGWISSQPVHCDLSDFCVLHWSPRCLIVRFVKGSFRLLLVVCHAPTAGHESRGLWWRDFADRVTTCAKGDRVVILGDLNARILEPVPGRIGDICWESDHAPPPPFFRLLRHQDLWVPATFSACHDGLSHTWVAPGGSAVSRIDYIIIPADWPVSPAGSRVLYDVDFGQSGFDHYAVRLDIDVVHAAWNFVSRPSGAFDASRLMQPASHDIVRQICASLPAVPWEVDAHSHYQLITEHLRRELADAFPRQRTTRRRTYLSDTTWTMRQQRVWWRRQAHRASAGLCRSPLEWAFTAWRQGRPWRTAAVHGLVDLFHRISGLRRAVLELRMLKPAFRRSLVADRKLYLSEVANAACQDCTRDVVAKLRPLLGPPKRRRRDSVPLPAVLLEDGTLASSP